jgi:signal transduction histidine kinase
MVDAVADRDPKLCRARLRIRKPLGRVSARPDLLLQAVTHLLDNAVRYVPENRIPEIDVWTESRPDRRRVLTIQDNGAGIPPEARETIFKPFIRLHEGLDDGGTGIGLAIVQRAVERMGGSVSLDSEPGRGSRFHVELPEA